MCGANAGRQWRPDESTAGTTGRIGKEAHIEERQIFGSILKQLEMEWQRDQEQLRNEFALFAQETGGRLMETQKNVAQLLTYGTKGIPQSKEPNPEPK